MNGRLGLFENSNSPTGIIYAGKVIIPTLFSASGKAGFASFPIVDRTATDILGTHVRSLANNVFGLDTFWPYDGWASTANGFTFFKDRPSTPFTQDVLNSLGRTVPTLMQQVGINDTFVTYLMYTPPGDDCIPVYLKKVMWHLDGTAHNSGTFQNPNWVGSGNSYGSSPGIPVYVEIDYSVNLHDFISIMVQ